MHSVVPTQVQNIKQLSDDVIDKIAAGEVIERPASVVKELLENAFDAQASLVSVDLEGGGLDGIVVTDDGHGMSPDDVELAFRRHATSKLRNAEDLFHIETLGFRGEALSSIASVARVQLTTRQHTQPVGTRIELAFGQVQRISEVGCPLGTSIWIRDLFENTPARRKFMRAPSTEQSHVVDAVLRVVLGTQRGGAVVHGSGRRLLDIDEGEDPTLRVRTALGRKVSDLYDIRSETDGVTISGYLAGPPDARRDTRGIWFFVNGRFVRDRMLQRALMDACAASFGGAYPVAVVYIQLTAAMVDVNVHPQKIEVRFGNGKAVYRAIAAALSDVVQAAPWLATHQNAPAMPSHSGLGESASSTAGDDRRGQAAASYLPFRPLSLGVSEQSTSASSSPDGNNEAGWPFGPVVGELTALQPMGAINARYWACRTGEGLALVDVDGVAQRVALDEMLAALAQGDPIPTYALMLPDIVDTDAAQGELLHREQQRLQRLGFCIEPMGPSRHGVREIPAALRGLDGKRILGPLSAALLSGHRDEQLLHDLSRLLHAPAMLPIPNDTLWRLFCAYDTAAANEWPKPYRVFQSSQMQSLMQGHLGLAMPHKTG